ncbi:bis(5'-nucleosyl)-tetraphosphatase PrpE [Salibacterium aidingense]|uniref:bis(5'-nucleosyl)-tetraphosphatase PrpE n=1 Tax=Salibacterium aidingense TaxID=384933 RepID=UPI0003F6A9AB|nr:bis(5'-nucleosyl)-tetraphosphatase PrpE [Salibacterium aidingense]
MHAYDFIGDIHGCYDELISLFHDAGYQQKQNIYRHPDHRIPVFIGDLMDRGPDSLAVIELVTEMTEKEAALYIPGNHCDKLYRYFIGRNITISGGLETTLKELEQLSSSAYRSLRRRFMKLYEHSPLYLRLDNDNVVAAHAGIPENLIGHEGKKVRTFVLYGDITGEKDEDGMPVRRDWAWNYTGRRLIVYGHTPVSAPRLINNTVNIDTGCVFGGYLTALHYPEMTFTKISSSMPYTAEKFRRFQQ